MYDYTKEGITQGTMGKLANISVSTFSRYLTNHNIFPVSDEAARNKRFKIEDSRNAIRAVLGDKFTNVVNKRHAFYNFKGGTGKTSICFQVATHLALMGYKVLVVDADPQAHLSVSFGFIQDDAKTLYDVIINNIKIEDVVYNVFPGLDCIPSNLSLTRLESELSLMPKREEQLKFVLRELEGNYDFILIDTNPTISALNRNVVYYSDIIEIVCETQPYSLNGLKILMEDLNKFFNLMKTPARQVNIIPNKYEDRTTNSAEAMTVLKQFYSELVKENFAVRRSEDIVTAAKLGKPLAFFCKKNSIALDDITELCHYIITISK